MSDITYCGHNILLNRIQWSVNDLWLGQTDDNSNKSASPLAVRANEIWLWFIFWHNMVTWQIFITLCGWIPSEYLQISCFDFFFQTKYKCMSMLEPLNVFRMSLQQLYNVIHKYKCHMSLAQFLQVCICDTVHNHYLKIRFFSRYLEVKVKVQIWTLLFLNEYIFWLKCQNHEFHLYLLS